MQPVDNDTLIPYGWDQHWVSGFRKHADHLPARVIRVDRGYCNLITPAGEARCQWTPLQGVDLSESGPPVTGDWVAARVNSDGGLMLSAILYRRTAVKRATTTGHQILAANIDSIFIVLGLDRPGLQGRFERSLVLALDSGARPIVILTKTDLVDKGDPAIETALSVVREADSDIEAIPVSNETGSGIDRVRSLLAPGETISLLGESGTGKSSLVNQLVGVDLLETQGTRRGDHKGRHTTTSRQLVLIPSGGVLIDTPGLRTLEVGLAEEGLALGFGDIEDLAAACRFRDCQHRNEPGCAISEAVGEGRLEQRRLEAYRTLSAEVAAEAQRVEQRRRRSGRRC